MGVLNLNVEPFAQVYELLDCGFRPEAVARWLSHRARFGDITLAIFAAVGSEPKSREEIAAIVQRPTSRVSNALARLRAHGLVKVTRRGPGARWYR